MAAALFGTCLHALDIAKARRADEGLVFVLEFIVRALFTLEFEMRDSILTPLAQDNLSIRTTHVPRARISPYGSTPRTYVPTWVLVVGSRAARSHRSNPHTHTNNNLGS